MKLVTVTRAEVSADLQHAKVYVSVMGSPKQQKLTMYGLNSATGFIQAEVANGCKLGSHQPFGFTRMRVSKRASKSVGSFAKVWDNPNLVRNLRRWTIPLMGNRPTRITSTNPAVTPTMKKIPSLRGNPARTSRGNPTGIGNGTLLA